jgi:DNA-binding Lrp family transcriptional regulator
MAASRAAAGPRSYTGPRAGTTAAFPMRIARGAAARQCGGKREASLICVFIQLRCTPGRTYEVADAIYDREFASELYSTSGEYDLIMKVYIPEGEDIGRFVAEHIRDIPHIDRSLTTLTFKAF